MIHTMILILSFLLLLNIRYHKRRKKNIYFGRMAFNIYWNSAVVEFYIGPIVFS